MLPPPAAAPEEEEPPADTTTGPDEEEEVPAGRVGVWVGLRVSWQARTVDMHTRTKMHAGKMDTHPGLVLLINYDDER